MLFANKALINNYITITHLKYFEFSKYGVQLILSGLQPLGNII